MAYQPWGQKDLPWGVTKIMLVSFFCVRCPDQPNWETSQTWTENIAAYLLGCIFCFCWYLLYSLLTLTTMMTDYHLSPCICSCRSERVPDVPNNPWPKSLFPGLQSTWWPTCEWIENTRPTGSNPFSDHKKRNPVVHPVNWFHLRHSPQTW